jgi:hypothetical protein
MLGGLFGTLQNIGWKIPVPASVTSAYLHSIQQHDHTAHFQRFVTRHDGLHSAAAEIALR